jgi:integrase
MRGSIEKQIKTLWLLSGIDRIGQSRHRAKSEAHALGKKTPQQVARFTGISSYNTKRVYLRTWKSIAAFAREPTADCKAITDITKVTGEVVASWLTSQADSGIKWSTFTEYAAAAEKLADALNGFAERFERHAEGRKYDFSREIGALRREYRDKLDRDKASRLYADPRKLIAALPDATHRLVASLQLDAKMRISEATLVRSQDLRGVAVDAKTGKAVGLIYNHDAKGGKNPTVPVCLRTYSALEAHVATHGELSMKDHQGYRDALAAAAALTRQEYTGSHGLRHNGACDRMIELRDAGVSYLAALQTCSREMGHERLSITLLYASSIPRW